MTILEFIILLVVAAICGSLAQAITGYTHGGCLVSAALGLIGAMLGTWLARTLALPEFFTVVIGGHAFPIVWSIVGAALFVAILGLLRSRRSLPPGAL
jgi:uncharacterized membrane protein YeaQ/YmgE (transglycosylase-associated protein family)